MSVFKRLAGGAHSVEAFEVNASQSFAWISGSATSSLSGSGFSINLVNQPPSNYPRSNLSIIDDESDVVSTLGGVTDGGFYSYPMFNSIEKFLYIGELSASGNNIYGFYPSGSMFVWNVGSKYTGDGIKPDTFKIQIDGNSDNIQDDGNAKLRINKTGSVVGNIFYNHGLVVFTETSSWSGSVNYSNLASGNYELESRGTERVSTHEYSVVIKPNEFNHSMNYSLRCLPSGSQYTLPQDSGSILSNQFLCSDFTGSDFQPYVTTIALYKNGHYDEPVIVGDLPKPIRISDKITMIFKLRLDM